MIRLEVAVVAFQGDGVAVVPFFQLVRACTHRIGIKVVALIDQGFGHNKVVIIRQIVEQPRIWLGGDLHRIAVKGFDLLHTGCVEGSCGERFRILQGGDHIRGGHLLPVMEFDALVQHKRPLHFIFHSAALGQIADRLQGRIVDPGQTIVHLHIHQHRQQ